MEELGEIMNKQHRKCYANDVNDEQLTPMFRQWATANFCVENMDFYAEVNKFKRANSINMKQDAEAIFRKFIAIGAPQEVNINYIIRVHIMRGLVDPKPELFDEAQEHILDLMQVDCFPRFFRSEPFVTRYKPVPVESLPDVLSPKAKAKGPPPFMQDTKSRAASLKTFLKRAVRPSSSDFSTRMHRSQSAVDAREGVTTNDSSHEFTSDWRETLRATLRGTLRSTRQSRAFTVPTPIPEESSAESGRARAESEGYFPPYSPPLKMPFSPPLSPTYSLPFSPHSARNTIALPQGVHHRHSKSDPFMSKGLRSGVVIIGYDRGRRNAREFDTAKNTTTTTTTTTVTPVSRNADELNFVSESSSAKLGSVESSGTKAIVESILESIVESSIRARTEPLTQTATEPTTELTAEPTSMPTLAPASEPISESSPEPISMPISEPCTESSVESSTETTTEATTETTTETTEVTNLAEPSAALRGPSTTADFTSNSELGSGFEGSSSDRSSSPVVDASQSETSSNRTSVSISDYGYSSNTDSGSYGYSSSAEASSTSVNSLTGATTATSASYVPFAANYANASDEKDGTEKESGKKSRFSKIFHGKFNFLFHHKSPSPVSQTKSANRRRHSTAFYMHPPQNTTMKMGAQLSLLTSPPALRKRRNREI